MFHEFTVHIKEIEHIVICYPAGIDLFGRKSHLCQYLFTQKAFCGESRNKESN